MLFMPVKKDMREARGIPCRLKQENANSLKGEISLLLLNRVV